jgi:VIT1/CCC1 family predicted Fe2+/Mn2+ transporter
MTQTDRDNQHSEKPDLNESGQDIKEPFIEKRLINPIERIAEVLFGLIMALSFTCAISVAEQTRIALKEMLFAAIGCNIAWGIIDAIMYLMISLAQRGRDMAILNYVRNTTEDDKAREYIGEIISPVVAAFMEKRSLEMIRQEIVNTAPKMTRPRIFANDLKSALGIFLLVFLSTIPVALPFALVNNVQLALRISNGIAIILLFLGGRILASYCGYNKFRTGLFLAIIGVGMVFLTISLGG